MNVPQREKNGAPVSARLAVARRPAGVARPRWGALAASILAGVIVGAWLWSGGSRNSLGDDVLSHLHAEPEALAAATGPLDPTLAAGLLERGRIRLGPEAGAVLHVSNCRFRRRAVLHLVVQAAGGPVTVLVLRDEPVDGPVSIAGRGFSGRIVPVGSGSIAVIGATGADLDRIAVQLRAAVEWL
jgi:hypothetical protein